MFLQGLECSRVDEFCKDVKSKTNCIEIYKENCSQQQETNMTILLQNHTKSLSEVNIFSPIASFSSSALHFIATFVFSNDSNITNKPLHFGISIEDQNFTILGIGLKVERKTHDSQTGTIASYILKYEMTDGNEDNKTVVQKIVYSVYPEKKSPFSLTVSFIVHMNLLQKKFHVIGNLIDMNQTKLILR